MEERSIYSCTEIHVLTRFWKGENVYLLHALLLCFLCSETYFTCSHNSRLLLYEPLRYSRSRKPVKFSCPVNLSPM